MESKAGPIEHYLIGTGLILIFFGMALLSLQTPARDFLFPYAPYIQISLLLGVFFMLLPVICLKIRPASSLLLILFYSLFIVALSTCLWSSYNYLVLQRTLMIFGSSLIIIVLVIADPKPIATFRILAKLLAFFGGFVSLLGIFIYFFGTITILDFGSVQSLNIYPLMSQRIYGTPPFLRMSSLFGNPNILAMWLMVTLTMTFYLFLSNSRRIFWSFTMLIQFCALVLTFSRAGILSTSASLAIFWYFSKNDRYLRYRHVIMMFCGFGFMVLAMYSLDLPQTIRLSLDYNYRDIIWSVIFTSIANNFATGVGFGVSYEAILEPVGIEFSAHNVFIMILSEIGIFGFMIFLFIWFFPMWHARSRLRSALPSARLSLAACLAISSGFIVNSLFEGTIMRFGFHTLIWVYTLAWMVHPSSMEEDNAKK